MPAASGILQLLLAVASADTAPAAEAGAPQTAAAEAGGPVVPEVSFALDVPLTAGALAGWWTLYTLHPDFARTSCPCRPAEAPRLERFAVERRWALAETGADLLAVLAVGAPVGLLAAVAPDVETWAGDALLVVESMALAGMATQAVKTATARPYPYMYGPAPHAEQNRDAVNYASFWSGHTAVPMASAVAFATLYGRRRPESRWRYVVAVLAPLLAVGAGALQVLAANHFPSDVVAGGLAGAATAQINILAHTP